MDTDSVTEDKTISELCAELDLSAAWLRKIGKHLGLPWMSRGTRGKKVYLSPFTAEFFRKIAALRWLGFGLREIKQIYQLEEMIVKELERFPSDAKNPSFLDLYFDYPQEYGMGGAPGYSHKKVVQDKEGAAKLQKVCDEYARLMRRVAVKAKQNYELLKQTVSRLDKAAEIQVKK